MKEKITDFVKYHNNADADIVEELKKSDLPLLIYGFGNNAKGLLEYLKSKLIKVKGIFVDDKYYTDQDNSQIPVLKKTEIDRMYHKYNVVVGMAAYGYAHQSLNHMHHVEHVYYFANPHLYLEESLITWDFFCKRAEEFQKSYEYFEDKTSKQIFVAYLNTVINKDYKYLMGFEGCNTYFNDEIIKPSRNEVFVDCGAYNGDSVQHFLQTVDNRFEKIYAIEPDPQNFIELTKKIEELHLNSINLRNVGLWDKKTKLKFIANNDQESSIINEENKSVIYEEIPVDTLDNILAGDKASLIKLSVQGTEYQALQGAQLTIKNFQPKVAMTIFMKNDSLLVLPQLIKKNWPNYKLYLRCEDPFWIRVILYAVPN